ncbi:MAG: protein-L-isoaspartate O-methyltransferase [Alphaproteobacteria bacterium]|jgi:protein-L-isoaspartate(D-aspartate) O-methyltransferase|nr:protein-L-isoaspartate O-methyltransferase [Alphaproteobacteria bacterium]
MTHQNFEKAREAMILSQLQPSGVVDPTVNAAYFSVPREMFVPEDLRGVSYLDGNMQLGHGRFLIEPIIFASMVQDAGLKKTDKILDIGCGTGYSTAILSCLAEGVVALDENEKLLHTARQNWENLGYQNISPVLGRHQDGYRNSAPYNAIFINGSVAACPLDLVEQLALSGKLYCVMMEMGKSTGVITVFSKTEARQLISRALGDATAPYLVGFEPKQEFEF